MIHRSPIILSSGVHMPVPELPSFFRGTETVFRAIVCKGTTLEAREGNPPPRLSSRGSRVANSIGLQNPGLPIQLQWINETRNALKCPVWLNLYEPDLPRSLDLLAREAQSIEAIEVNMSCPNVSSPEFNAAVLKELRSRGTWKILLKVSPDFFNLDDDAKKFLEVTDASIDGIVVSNSLPASKREFREPFLRETVGTSGPHLLKRNLETMSRLRAFTPKLLIGCGGVAHVTHVESYLAAGADAVEVGILNLYDPMGALRLAREWLNVRAGSEA